MPPRLHALRAAICLLTKPSQPSRVRFIVPFLAPAQQRAASILSALSDTPGAYHKRIRRGRGPASGKGKTAGRGQKGQHAHGKVPAGFQGGQTPMEITHRVRGRRKHNPFKVEMSPINLDRIQSWIDQGRLNPKKPITIKDLAKSRCLHGIKKDGVKLLANTRDNANALKTPINIIVSRVSASAIAAVEAVGGTVTTRFYSPVAIKNVLGGKSHPTISLQSSSELMQLTAACAKTRGLSPFIKVLSSSESSVEAREDALMKITEKLKARFPYRLPDATSRKDIEYYRDPAHRGYLRHTVAEGQSPSLYFKVREQESKGALEARKKAAERGADNRLW